MQLLEEDERYLTERCYQFDLIAEGEVGCLIIKDFPLASGKYDRDIVDLLICIPKGYNTAKLDNFYIDPPIRLKVGGAYPHRGDYFESHIQRKWQRLSRHMSVWRPGIDGLRTFMPFIYHELQNKD